MQEFYKKYVIQHSIYNQPTTTSQSINQKSFQSFNPQNSNIQNLPNHSSYSQQPSTLIHIPKITLVICEIYINGS